MHKFSISAIYFFLNVKGKDKFVEAKLRCGTTPVQFAALRSLIYTFFSTRDAVMSVTDRTGVLIFHAQAHFSAEPAAPFEDTRVSYAYEDQEGRAVLSRRRAKGRKRVAVKPGFRE